MKMSESLIKIAPALLKAQKEIGGAKKGADNPFFKSKYADFGAVLEACKDILNKHGITIVQAPDIVVAGDNAVGVLDTVFLHESGEYISGAIEIKAKDENDPQKYGAGLTYSRRQGLQSMAVIPAEDDDGNFAANKNNSKVVSKKPAAKPVSQPEPADLPEPNKPADSPAEPTRRRRRG